MLRRPLPPFWFVLWLLLPAGCAQPVKGGQAVQPGPGPASAPLRITAIEVREGKAVRNLERGEPLQAGEDFALHLSLSEPLYLYVVVEHADQSVLVLLPKSDQALTVTGAAAVRVPQAGDTFLLDKVYVGDRLCLVASGATLAPSQVSCSPAAGSAGKSRGEDRPPPPPPSKEQEAKTPPPPPPADSDRSREGGRWVLHLPLATP